MTPEATSRHAWTERLPGWARGRVERIIGSDFAHKVGETMATRVALIAIGLVTSVLIARSLGPEGRGLQAAIAAITSIGVQFGNLGLHSSNTYYVAKRPSLLPTLVGNSLLVTLGLGVVGSAVAWVVLTVWPSLSPVDGWFLVFALAGVPIGLTALLLQNLLLGIHQVRTYNLIELGTRIGMVAVVLGLILADRVSVVSVAITGLLVSAAAAMWAYLAVGPHLTRPIRVSLSELKQHARYGFKAYVAAFFAFTVIRADVLLCSYLLGDGATGHYSIAVSMADMVYMLPVVAGTLAFPRLAATEDHAERWAKAKSMFKWVAALLVAVAVAAALLAQPAVRLLYGESFLPAVPAFLLLLPGIVALGANTILMNYFAAEGIPPVAVWSPAVASVMNIGLNLILLPRMGIAGASLASTTAYAMMLAMSLAYIAYRRSRGTDGSS